MKLYASYSLPLFKKLLCIYFPQNYVVTLFHAENFVNAVSTAPMAFLCFNYVKKIDLRQISDKIKVISYS